MCDDVSSDAEESATLSLTIDDAGAGERVDVFAASLTPKLSRSRIKRLIEEGLLLVDGRRVRPSYRLRTGDGLSVTLPPPAPVELIPEAVDLDVLYEDDHLVAVNKPPGMVVHPAPGHDRGTLVHALLNHCGELSSVGGFMRPGIVHRLDKDTSGVLVATKTDAAHQALAERFSSRRVEKTYLALVWGDPGDEGRSTRPIGRHPTHRHKMAAGATRGGREADTRWRVRGRLEGGVSLLQVDILTGRTHQIRVHMSDAGHPVVGDSVYGGGLGRGRGLPGPVKAALGGVDRQMLHSWRLGFDHPVSGEGLELIAVLPEDFLRVVTGLGGAVFIEEFLKKSGERS